MGTKYAWGHNILVRLDPTRKFCAFWGDKPITSYNPITNTNQHCGPDSYLVGMGSGLDQQQFNWILANAWKLDVKFIDHWSGDDETYVWPSKNPQTVTQLAKTFMKKGIVDYAGDIQVADAEEWPRTLAVRRG